MHAMKAVVVLGKLATIAVWFWGILSFLLPAEVPAPSIGRMVVLGLLAVHVAEAFAFAKSLAAETGQSPATHRGQLLLFGYIHVLSTRYGQTTSR